MYPETVQHMNIWNFDEIVIFQFISGDLLVQTIGL